MFKRRYLEQLLGISSLLSEFYWGQFCWKLTFSMFLPKTVIAQQVLHWKNLETCASKFVANLVRISKGNKLIVLGVCLALN